MGHAADFSDAKPKACVVAGEIIANQLAIPLAKEVACMFARTAWTKVVTTALTAEYGVVQ
jgi:hypothetical protein